MGMFDNLRLDDGVSLPHFPDAYPSDDLGWQTKTIGHPHGQVYRLTADGRLLRREEIRRDKTTAERQEEAAEHGFDSWEAYTEALDDLRLEEKIDRGLPTVVTTKVVEEVWWANHNPHGTIEFHAGTGNHEPLPDLFLSYEAEFYKGELRDLVFRGDRQGSLDRDEAIAALEASDASR